MPVKDSKTGPVWQRRTPRAQLALWMGWALALAILIVCAREISQNTLWVFVADAHLQGADLIGRMIPPDFGYLNQLWRPLWDTLNIATLGTILAVLLAVPLAFLAAKNTTPHGVVRQVSLILIVSSRSINTLIWAILFVIVFGPGVVAGVVAITLRSIGFIAKLLYEAIEEISTEPVEAIRATGATSGQVLNYAIVPQVFPSFVGISVFRWDINIRESTIVGLVGAGGIGLQLDASVNALRWSQVSMILVLVFIMVVFSEWISAHIRKAVL